MWMPYVEFLAEPARAQTALFEVTWGLLFKRGHRRSLDVLSFASCAPPEPLTGCLVPLRALEIIIHKLHSELLKGKRRSNVATNTYPFTNSSHGTQNAPGGQRDVTRERLHRVCGSVEFSERWYGILSWSHDSPRNVPAAPFWWTMVSNLLMS